MDGMQSLGRMLDLRLVHVLLLLGAAGACAPGPREADVRGVITRYFQERGYRVADLRIGGMSALPLSEKTYMGTEGYRVSVAAITLEATEEIGEPWNYRKGQVFSFNDAVVLVRERPEKKGDWMVVKVSGIPVR